MATHLAAEAKKAKRKYGHHAGTFAATVTSLGMAGSYRHQAEKHYAASNAHLKNLNQSLSVKKRPFSVHHLDKGQHVMHQNMLSEFSRGEKATGNAGKALLLGAAATVGVAAISRYAYQRRMEKKAYQGAYYKRRVRGRTQHVRKGRR